MPPPFPDGCLGEVRARGILQKDDVWGLATKRVVLREGGLRTQDISHRVGNGACRARAVYAKGSGGPYGAASRKRTARTPVDCRSNLHRGHRNFDGTFCGRWVDTRVVPSNTVLQAVLLPPSWQSRPGE